MTTEIQKNFRETCCHKLGIPEEDFEKTVLLACLPPWYLPVGRWRWRWRFTRSYFDTDLELIRQAGNCTSTKAIISEISDHRYHYPERGFQRKVLHARVSGQRLVNFESQFLHSTPNPAEKCH